MTTDASAEPAWNVGGRCGLVHIVRLRRTALPHHYEVMGTVFSFAFRAPVDAEAIRSARAAGLSEVLPRGRFVQVLPELLRP